MVGRKFALLVATNRYEKDTQLGGLKAPANDVKNLAAVLRDRQVAGFDVTILRNKPHHQVERVIGEFYADRRRDDLTLLYFTGHGVKDEGGRLHLATVNTRISNLRFTAVQAERISAAMNECRSGQKVLILDCCYGGAFPSGFDPKSDPFLVNALENLGGQGSVVLTSSDAMQYSFEDNRVTEMGSAPSELEAASLFTRIMVEGLKSGAADLDHDGDITLDELYQYVHNRVTREQPHQHPQIKEDADGRICIAQNVGWTLPPHIAIAIDHLYPDAKLSALRDLRGLHFRGNALVRQRVLEAVCRLTEDDSTLVKQAAGQLLSELGPPDGQPQSVKRPAHPAAEQARSGEREPDVQRGGKRSASAVSLLPSQEARQAQREAGERRRDEAEQKQREVEERARAAGLRAEKEWQESAKYALQELLSSTQRAENRQRRPEMSASGPEERYEAKVIVEDSSPGTMSPGSAPPGSAGRSLAGPLRDRSRWLALAVIGLLVVVLIALATALLVTR
jgi:hypothetical protein